MSKVSRVVTVSVIGSIVSVGSAQSLTELGEAGKYTVLGVANSRMTISSGNTRVNGNVGVGQGGSLTFSGGGKISGVLDRHPTASVSITGGSTVGSGLFEVDLDQASSDAIAASNVAAAQSPTQVLGNIGNGASVTGAGGINVYDVSSIGLSGGTFSVTGSSSDRFIFNITGAMNLSGGSKIKLTGVPLDQVWFNLIGEGQRVNFSGNSEVDGTILAINRDITVSGGKVNGSIMGALNKELKLQSGPEVNPVPEPATLAVFASGLFALRRKKATKSN